ncbi:uncharacterized protein [Centruroides vittatus]|uniref:uncharacterized protein n=1 Tax=Centruroides vittatus TaxID=120091 RepID=UPI00350ECD88
MIDCVIIAMNKTKSQDKHHLVNFVHEDLLWKDQIHREEAAAREWPNKWGSIKDECLRLQQELLKIPAETSETRCEYSYPFCLDGGEKQSDGEKGKIIIPPYPNTSSRMIGWLSSRSEFNLEIFGNLREEERILPPKVGMAVRNNN